MSVDVPIPDGKKVTRLLLTVVVCLILLSVAGQVSKYYLGHERLKGFVPAFYVDLESNVPTWYSSFALSLAGALLLVVAACKVLRRDAYRYHWAALSALFFLLSVDEVAMFHEYPIYPLREALGAGGALYYTWVLPGVAFVAVVAISFWRFLRHLPARTRNGFLLAGAVFVGGAIGVEMLSGVQADRFGEETFGYSLIITAEEFMEMLGVVLFIRAIIDYIDTRIGKLRLSISPVRQSEPCEISCPT